MSTTQQVFQEVTELGLSTLSAEYAEYVAEHNKQAMETIWAIDETSEQIAKLKLDDILKKPFNLAHQYINQFSMAKRISMLDELNVYRKHLYEQINRYGGDVPKDEQISAAEFRMLMGKIKHLEIIQNWLYGII